MLLKAIVEASPFLRINGINAVDLCSCSSLHSVTYVLLTQIDLQNHTHVTGIILQGMNTPLKSGYVVTFHLTFSNDSIYWTSEEQPVGHRKVRQRYWRRTRT